MRYNTLYDAAVAQRLRHQNQPMSKVGAKSLVDWYLAMTVAACAPGELHVKPVNHQLHYDPEKDYLYEFGLDPHNASAKWGWHVKDYVASMTGLAIIEFHRDVYLQTMHRYADDVLNGL